MRPIRKAVFPVAGLDTGFLPASKAMSKEMFPVVDKYGIIADTKVGPTITWVTHIVEKPRLDQIVGSYVLEPDVFNYLKRISPGKGGEI